MTLARRADRESGETRYGDREVPNSLVQDVVVSDNYRIRVPESIDAKMSAWDLPADIRRSMEDRLRSVLTINSSAHLKKCIAPWGERLNLYSFTLPSPD